MTGPIDTEDQARALPAVRAAWDAWEASPGVGRLAAHNRVMLGRALEIAGVAMGRYDDRIAEWLSGFEPTTVAVIAGWITRAAERDIR
jgi:hypothetical protein